MLTNRRMYRPETGKVPEARQIAREIKDVLKAELEIEMRILSPVYGPAGVFVFEFDYANQAELEQVSRRWHALIEERGLVRRWFAVAQFVSNELWSSFPPDAAPARAEAAPAPRD